MGGGGGGVVFVWIFFLYSIEQVQNHGVWFSVPIPPKSGVVEFEKAYTCSDSSLSNLPRVALEQ